MSASVELPGGQEASVAGPRSEGTSPQFSLRLVDDWDELESVRAEWDPLALDAIEPSPSSESWMLIPALRYLAAPGHIRVALVYSTDPGVPGSRTLCGVFPLEVQKGYKGLPVTVLRLWNHLYSLFPAPLLRAEHAGDCIRALLSWVREAWPGSTLVEFPELRAESAFFRTLTDVLREDGHETLVISADTRAIFRPRQNADEYIGAIGTAHHRKEMRRQERRLSETGSLRYERFALTDDVDAWLEEFMTLELAGWKGKEGTAFGCRDDHRAYLTDVAKAAVARSQLMMLRLYLDDKPLALKINFLAPPGGYTFKIAYDEAYFKYSPGVLLELENIRRLHADPAIRWMDSLAVPDHPMVNRLWLDRTGIVSLLVAPGRIAGGGLLALLPLMKWLKRRLGR